MPSRNGLRCLSGYQFKESSLLKRALTHRSFGPDNNERLEFLGDSVFGMVVSNLLYRRFPHAEEGQLTRMRARLVRRESLERIARRYHLGESLVLGSGALRSGGSNQASILADALEALIGAIYLDAGLTQTETFIESLFGEDLSQIDPQDLAKDPKTTLQEFLQERGLPLPTYCVKIIEGEAHQPRFLVDCLLGDRNSVYKGEGSSRRSAEQDAAKRALEEITG